MKNFMYLWGLGSILGLTFAMGCNKKSDLLLDSSTIKGNVLQPTPQKEFKTLADWLKSSIAMVPDQVLNKNVKRHCMRLKLVDARGDWKVDELKAQRERICPNNIEKVQLIRLIDESAYNMQSNQMLDRFLEKAKSNGVTQFRSKTSRNRGTDVGELVAWAYVLEQITATQLEDPKNIKILHNHWISERHKEGFKPPKNITNVFGALKLASVEKPITDIISFFEKCRKLDTKFARGFLPLNISEAMAADMLMGNVDNSAAGWPLFNNAPGEAPDQLLGTGPATFSKDGRKLEIRMSLPKQWADLYQVWNMAFVSQVDDAPFWWTKLLIPSVSAYKDFPEEYIYRRVLALYTSLIHGGFLSEEYNDGREDYQKIQWSDKDLTKLWGQANKLESDYYKSLVATKRKAKRNIQ
jgi:hypothetical protein